VPDFYLKFDPAEYLAFDREYALRTSLDGWGTDLAPVDRWQPLSWTLACDRYEPGFECKFVLVRSDADRSQDVWMLGENLRIAPAPQSTYYFAAQHSGSIAFPFYLRLVGGRYADAKMTLRDQANGWADRSGWYDGGAWWFEIPWTDYFDSSEAGPSAVRYKFVKDGEWMVGPNLQIGPDDAYEPGEFAHVGHMYDTLDTSVEFRGPG
jgi:hypothetical protein